jgi:hypothetical protein
MGRNNERKHMRHLIIIIITFFIIGCASTKKVTVQNQIILDRSVMSNQNTSTGWMAYGLSLKAWPVELDKNGKPNLYEREVFARSKTALIWQGLRDKKTVNPDEYLDALVAINDANFMAEYVWSFIYKASVVQPSSLKLGKFKQWMTANLPGHKAVINTGVSVPILL